MSQIKGSKTQPELQLRRLIKGLGLDYRLDSKLLGKPDIKISGHKTVLFLDGCFWHRCPTHYVQPINNKAFWKIKIAKNALRDRVQAGWLKTKGYKVIRIWEHELKNKPALKRRLKRLLKYEIRMNL